MAASRLPGPRLGRKVSSMTYATTTLLALLPLMVPSAVPKTRDVAILLYEGVEILDFAGPAEVFEAASKRAGDGVTPALRLYTVAKTKAPITAQGFVKITPEFAISDAPPPDILVIPGGQSSSLSADPALMKWLHSAVDRAEVTLTVCTGVFPLAAQGRLDGQEVTTWYGAVERLERLAPKARIARGRRFVDNGALVVTAGVSAGIDGSLHLVARLYGRRIADQTAQYMEYRWAPEPYLAPHYKALNPSTDERGRALQSAELASDEGRLSDAIEQLRGLIRRDANDEVAWFRLGNALGQSGDRKGAIEAYSKVRSTPQLRGPAQYNAACYYVREGDRGRAKSALASAFAAGISRSIALEDPDLSAIRGDIPSL